MRKLIRWMTACGLAAMGTLAGAQAPYRIIVPSGPGTGNDVLFRSFAPILSEQLQAPVVVENRAGGDGAVAVRELTRAGTDGRTLLATTDNMLTMNHLITPYDPKAIKPLVWLMRTTAVLVAKGDGGKYRNLEEFLAAARAKPETVPIGIGAGVYRFNLALMEKATNTRFKEVPYAGTATQMITDMLGGNIDATMLELGGALPQIQSGRMRALAVMGPERSPVLPDVPTIAGSGYSYSMNMLFGLSVAGGTPDAIAKPVEAAIQRAGRQKATADFFNARGQQVYNASGDEVAPSLDRTATQFRELVTSTDILKRVQGN